MLWAIAAVITCGMIGLGIDFARAQSLRSALQNAADGAALVAERNSHLPLEEREAAARAYFDQSLGDNPMTESVSFTLVPLDDGGHRINVSLEMDLSLANLVNPDGWEVAVTSSAMADASPPIEVALVLDNTGSMSSDMDTLRDVSEEFIEFLFAIDGDTVHMALVPFVAQVNIGNSATQLEWMDTAGTSPYNGELLEDRQIGWRNTTGAGATCQLLNTLPYNNYATYIGADGAALPYRINWVRHNSLLTGNSCRAFTPNQINYFDLYPANDPWKGCVEARPEPFDVTDDAPTTPETRFTPYFWLDTYGDAGDTGNNSSTNSWINNGRGNITLATNVTMTSGSDNDPSNTERRRSEAFNVFKYRGRGVNGQSIDTSAPNTRGPNRGCPTPIVPLTDDEETLQDAAADMEHWNGGGTNQVEGLAWGWRVLSPTAPFTEGEPYGDEVRKVIVLMTDGQNTNIGDDYVWDSDYSAYNHLGLWTDFADGSLLNDLLDLVGGILHGLLDEAFWRDDEGVTIEDHDTMEDYINARERRLCDNIKEEDIEIYTVIFRETDGVAQEILRDCATSEEHYFRADNADELRDAFRAIGSGIGQLRLTH